MISRRAYALLLVVLIVLSLALVSASHAAVLTVTNTADDFSPGCLRWCIAQAQPGDEIVFDPSLDGQPIVLNGHWLHIDKDLTISGSGQANTIIDGDRRSRVFVIDDRAHNVTISGLTIQNGYTSSRSPGGQPRGGGIWIHGSLTLTQSTVSGNSVEVPPGWPRPSEAWGGGIHVSRIGSLTLTNSTVSGNSAEAPPPGSRYFSAAGGGIFSTGSLIVTNSTISGNSADVGGGLYAQQLTLRKSTILDNYAREAAGGMWVVRGPATVTDCTIGGNQGGGVLVYHSGIPALNLSHSTVYANGWFGVGVIDPFDGLISPATIRNSIVAQHDFDCFASPPLLSQGHNLDSDGSCGFDQPSDLPDTDPMLGPLQDNWGPTWTRVPLEGSPVIDRGWCDPGTDQRGVPRPLDGDRDNVWICDIGAVEYVPYEVEVIGPGGDVIVIPPDSD